MFKKLFSRMLHRNESACRIEKIDITNQTVIIACLGIETAICASLDDIVFDRTLINNLPALQVSWLGYSYGKAFLRCRQPRSEQSDKEDLENDKYILFCLDREGYFIYIDKANQKQYRKVPSEILRDKKMLQEFSKQQILYISIQAGLYSNRRRPAQQRDQEKHLKLVKK